MTNAQITLAVCGALALGCTPDLTGILAADRTGDLLTPAAERGDALAVIRAACGPPEAVDARIARHPYVQGVASDRARVTWTTTDTGEQALRTWTTGAPEKTVAAQAEPTRYLAGARQLGAELVELGPRTVHCYEIVDAGGARLYGPDGFRTAPTVGAEESVAIAVFGDSGFGSSDQAAVATQLATVPLDLVLSVGDVAYANGTLEELERNHFAMYRGLQASIPFYPAIGDHDEATDGAGPLREVYTLPPNGVPGRDERFYSFDWGPVHVVVIDAINGGAQQRDWVARDLAATPQRWRIAVIHVPPYSSGFHGSGTGIRAEYAPLFAEHGVQLVLSGDDHDYERSRPIDGVTYVVTGGGGRSVRPVGTSEWTAFSVTAFHFVYLRVEGDELRLHAIDATGREFDGVSIRLDGL